MITLRGSNFLLNGAQGVLVIWGERLFIFRGFEEFREFCVKVKKNEKSHLKGEASISFFFFFFWLQGADSLVRYKYIYFRTNMHMGLILEKNIVNNFYCC